ncbi:MAG: fibronectin type III domain-containing protein [Weeksellaceae bacterium]
MKIKFILSYLFVQVVLCGLQGQVISPTIQAIKPESVWFTWKNETSITPTVKYGTSIDNLSMNASGETKTLGNRYEWNTVKLTNLEPDTGYYYQVFNGKSSSDIHYFRTPGKYGNNGGKLRLLFLGDHQMINYKGSPWNKYDELVLAAKDKIKERFGGPLADQVDLIVNVGDQVDWGTLEYYDKVHFQKQRYIASNLSCLTSVGNHETYGINAIQKYEEHFILDDNFEYQGIDSGTERYYAYQMENILFIVMDSELKGSAQAVWANQVIDAAKNDSTVDWIITNAHRPYEAEQYSNDYLQWYHDEVLPNLKTTPKFVLHIAGHHHLYARGQIADHEAYHMITGGTAWPQYWGDSTNEEDKVETQGTWSNFAYQIMEIDNDNMSFDVKTYTIGSVSTEKDNELLDEFHYNRYGIAPNKPLIENTIEEGKTIALPYTFNSSSFSTDAVNENYNSTQFQIARTSSFNDIKLDIFRNKDNFYGPLNGQKDESENIGLGEGIFNLTINSGELDNGDYVIRVRHRDESLKWSDWSDPVKFTVGGSSEGQPMLALDKSQYNLGDAVTVSYSNSKNASNDWIGIYEDGTTNLNIFNDPPSHLWSYIDGINGSVSFTPTEVGGYFATLFADGGRTEIAERIPFFVGSIPIISTDKTKYKSGERVKISYTGASDISDDWIGIYKVGVKPARNSNVTWDWVANSPDGSFDLSVLDDGFYYAQYHPNTGYSENFGNQVRFQVGEKPAKMSIDKMEYKINEPIVITFKDAPGLEKDYFGIYEKGIEPAAGELYTYKYFGGLSAGTVNLDGVDGGAGAPNQLPIKEGEYYIVMFTDDSYTEVSNREYFTVINTNEPQTGLLNSDEWIVGGMSNGVIKYGEKIMSNDFARGESAGNVKVGGVYAFKTDGNNYALGVQPTPDDATPGFLELRVQNTTNKPFKHILLQYTIKTLNNSNGSVSIKPSYKIADGNYKSISILDYNTPERARNISEWTEEKKYQIIDLYREKTLNPGEYIYIRWNIDAASETEEFDEFALDDVSVEYAH